MHMGMVGFVMQALENNLDIIAKKKNYMDYLANRPGVEKTGTHGLFSNEGESIYFFPVVPLQKPPHDRIPSYL